MPKSKAMCSGCEDNYYNGYNDRGIKTCWRYKTAKIVKTVIASINEPPPFCRVEKCLNCYTKKGYAYLTNFDKITKGEYKGQYCYSGDADFWNNKGTHRRQIK